MIDFIMRQDRTTAASLLILFACLLGIMTYVIFQAIYHSRKLTYCTNIAKAKVVDKKHVKPDSYVTMKPIGKMLMPKTHEAKEKFYVSLRVDSEVHTINNRGLYCGSEIGDYVDVIVHDGYDKQGLLKSSYITLAH